MTDILIKGGQCCTPNGIKVADVAITSNKITAIGDLSGLDAVQVIDARHLHVLPGVIDSQVHFREPGLEYKEDLASGSKAAALGGVTTFFEMPNTNPSTTTPAAITDKLQRAAGRSVVNYAFYGGVAGDNHAELTAMEQMAGCAGLKIFMGSSTGSLLVADDAVLLHALQQVARRVAIHAEDEALLLAGKAIATEAAHPRAHPHWRSVQVCLQATTRILRLARQAGNKKVHVLHVTTGEEMALLAQYKDIATVEVTPQHLTLAAPDCYEGLGTLAQMNPPIRDAAQREALWQAINNGIVDVIGSDHAPHTSEEKARPYPASPSGMPGVQTLLPLMLTHVNQGRLSLERLVDLVCHGPQRIFGIRGKGRLAVGYDADITLVDMARKQRIEQAWLASKCGWSPFTGEVCHGWPTHTIVMGAVVMVDNALTGIVAGQPVLFG